jgi:aminoglycoside 3-N-acetyltransferase
MTTTLFESPSGPVSTVDLREALLRVGADECDVLYIHSGLTFGTPAGGLKRRDLLMEILAALRDLQVSTICMPTFTFSFCNGESFDRQNSKSQMGALNEFFRVQPDADRQRLNIR